MAAPGCKAESVCLPVCKANVDRLSPLPCPQYNSNSATLREDGLEQVCKRFPATADAGPRSQHSRSSHLSGRTLPEGRPCGSQVPPSVLWRLLSRAVIINNKTRHSSAFVAPPSFHCACVWSLIHSTCLFSGIGAQQVGPSPKPACSHQGASEIKLLTLYWTQSAQGRMNGMSSLPTPGLTLHPNRLAYRC